MIRFFTLSFIIFVSSNATLKAQTKKGIDSLENRLNTKMADTNRVNLLVELAIAYETKDSVKTLRYISEALKLANKINYVDGQLLANNNFGIFYMDYYQFEKSLINFKQVEFLAKKNNKEPSLAKLYGNMGNLFSDWQKTEEALRYYNKSIEIGLKYNNKKSVAVAYGNIGNTYIQSGNLVLATTYLLKGIAIREEINDKKGVANMSSNLSVLYKELGKYDDAITYGNNATAYFKSAALPIDEGRVYVNLGLVANRQKDYPKAEKYYREAIKLFKGTTYTRGLAACYTNLGNTLKNQNKISEALQNYNDAYLLAKKNDDKEAQAISLIELGGLSTLKKDFDGAENSLLQALKIAEDIKYLKTQKDVNEALAELYVAKGNYEKGLDYTTKTTVLKDSMLAIDKVKVIEDVKIKYETEKKEFKILVLSKADSIKSLQIENQQISIIDNLLKISNQKLELTNADLKIKEDELQLKEADLVIKTKEEIILQNKLDAQQKEQRILLLNKEKKIKELELKEKNIAILSILGFCILLAFSGFSFYRKKQTQNRLLLQAEVIKQQDLATKGILEAEEKERERIAKDLHDGVGQVMSAAKMNLSAFESDITFKDENQRLAFERVINLIDEGCKEVRSVSHQMMPNALLKAGLASAIKEFIDKIDNRILKINLYSEGLNERIDSNIEIVLYRIIQECVNNVIKHSGANQLDISLIKDKDGLSVTIEDNGKGFNVNDKSKFDGMGLKNIYSRIEFLKGTIDMDSAPGKGTLVAINVPVV